jgi:hypothetical protein
MLFPIAEMMLEEKLANAGFSVDARSPDATGLEKSFAILVKEKNIRNTTNASPPTTNKSVSTNDNQLGKPRLVKLCGIGRTTTVITAASNIGFRIKADALIPHPIIKTQATATSKKIMGCDLDVVMIYHPLVIMNLLVGHICGGCICDGSIDCTAPHIISSHIAHFIQVATAVSKIP